MKAYRATEKSKKKRLTLITVQQMSTGAIRLSRAWRKEGAYDPKQCAVKKKETRGTSTEKMTPSSKKWCGKCELVEFGDEQRETVWQRNIKGWIL